MNSDEIIHSFLSLYCTTLEDELDYLYIICKNAKSYLQICLQE